MKIFNPGGAYFTSGSLAGAPSPSLAFLLLHGNFLDELLIFGVIIYLATMFVLAEVKKRRLRREKLRRRAERLAQNAAASPAEVKPSSTAKE